MLKQKMAEDEERMYEEKKKMADKKQSYAKYVKEMYWPKVSTRKQLELEQFKEKLKSQNLRRASQHDMNSIRTGRQVGNFPQSDTEDHRFISKEDHWKRRGLNSVREDNDGSEGGKKKKPIIWKTKKREAAKSVAGTVPPEA